MAIQKFRVRLGDGGWCNVEEVRPCIFVLKFANHYDCCMHLLRYEERFECAHFRGKRFRIFDYMRWYASKCAGTFDYPDNWSGFNIRSAEVRAVFRAGIPDPNQYDVGMASIYFACSKRSGGKEFSLIAGEDTAMHHEMAHALYYTERQYRIGMDALLRKVPKEARRVLWAWLKAAGYADERLPDEAQAYLATGMSKMLKTGRKEIQAARAPFIRFFREHEKI